ncbi:DUF177 domain-containing protein [Ancylobacter sp. 6x-1]|uniref:DUF177 domain-containing protein n=1 Tax=Ancylobacter crimeensis TaxID=2579147 RepID=A0ABT0DDB1_9HYPH|nr:YceD family protein [Ancylobacter crimeensis]MCK0197732.1 DUF177 domain-containing protein [Ancylobacter crimeensis]
MSDALPFSHPVNVASLPDDGTTLRLAPDEATRAAIAQDFGIPGVPALSAKVTLVPDHKGGVRVGGHVEAVVTQICVATLEPFDAPVSEEIDMHFVPEHRIEEPRPGAEIEVGSDDIPDVLVGDVVDVGGVVCEFLALGLDPYPRKPGAVFEGPNEGPDSESPFAALKKLATPPDED